MNKAKGPIILFIVIGILVVVGYYGSKHLLDRKDRTTSDTNVKVEEVRGGGDGYLGYGFIHTLEMKKQLARTGLAINYTDDGGNYEERLKKFMNKEYDFITLPINSYIEHGLKHNFPGKVVWVIAESKGADAIVGFPQALPNGSINDMDNPNLKIHYIPASPNSFLIDLTISDFALEELQDDPQWRIEHDSPKSVYDAAKQAAKDNDTTQLFTLWDPEATKAVESLGLTKLWGSDQFSGYILDVFVFHRDYIAKDRKKVVSFLETYNRVLSYYNSRPDEMIKELSKISGAKKTVVEKMINNIDWYDLNQNCTEMFDIQLDYSIPSRDGIINSIYACSDVMMRSGSIKEDVDDPYLLINSSFMEELSESTTKTVGASAGKKKHEFIALKDKEWKKLNVVGTMRVQDINFQGGTITLDYNDEKIVDEVAKLLVNNYPNYRVEIRGHTGKGGEAANMKLSQDRADVVKQRLVAVHGVNPDRLHAKGYGALMPPKKKGNENPRRYMMRWSRVEFVLLSDDRL